MKKLIFLVLLALGFYLNRYEIKAFLGKHTTLFEYETPPVELYVKNVCGYCQNARDFFRRNNIDYEEYNINTSEYARSRYNDFGGGELPMIVINNTVLNGFNTYSIREALYKQ